MDFLSVSGLAVGNGLTDPISMINYSELVYQLGLADLATKNEMKAAEDYAKQAIIEERYVDAFDVSCIKLACLIPMGRTIRPSKTL